MLIRDYLFGLVVSGDWILIGLVKSCILQQTNLGCVIIT
jgi:hypothetical protein